MTRFVLILLSVILVALIILLAARKDPGEGRNFILVTLDTTRADHLGCYGYPKNTSPHLDRMAAESVLFDLAIAQASVTPVSHASILTGLYPFQHGLRVLFGESCYRLEENAHPTLAKIFDENGWKTAAFISAFPVSEFFGLDQGFEIFDSHFSDVADATMEMEKNGTARWDLDNLQRGADVTVGNAIDWLASNTGPFFMWVHLFDPHDTQRVPPDAFTREWLGSSSSSPAANSKEYKLKMYDAEIAYMDQQLGRLFDYLKEAGLYENTVIIITNDHGEGLGDHDWWHHRILYQEQIRMPLIIRFPEKPVSMRIPDLVRSIDIMPTLLEYAGLPIPPMAGKSLMGLIGGESEPERIAYADALLKLDHNFPSREGLGIYDDLMYCAMTRSWKLIYHDLHSHASHLYKIDEDPKEKINLFDKQKETGEDLLRFLRQEGIMIEELIPPTENVEISNKLKQLGY